MVEIIVYNNSFTLDEKLKQHIIIFLINRKIIKYIKGIIN